MMVCHDHFVIRVIVQFLQTVNKVFLLLCSIFPCNTQRVFTRNATSKENVNQFCLIFKKGYKCCHRTSFHAEAYVASTESCPRRHSVVLPAFSPSRVRLCVYLGRRALAEKHRRIRPLQHLSTPQRTTRSTTIATGGHSSHFGSHCSFRKEHQFPTNTLTTTAPKRHL